MINPMQTLNLYASLKSDNITIYSKKRPSFSVTVVNLEVTRTIHKSNNIEILDFYSQFSKSKKYFEDITPAIKHTYIRIKK
jgi:hypothetical protein